MGLRCLIGHDYGEPQSERDRHQQGSEVVVTVSEYRECTRCGHRRVISENTEVTAERPAEPAEGSDPDPSGTGEVTEPPAEPSAGFSRSASDDSVSAAEDDGVILDDDSETAEPRGYGEWPATEEADAETDAEAGPWPNEPEGTAEKTGDEAPTTASSSTDQATEPPAVDATAEASQPSPEPRPDPSETELVCPDCDESWPSVNASLRPGDICPECRRGYLDERVIQ